MALMSRPESVTLSNIDGRVPPAEQERSVLSPEAGERPPMSGDAESRALPDDTVPIEGIVNDPRGPATPPSVDMAASRAFTGQVGTEATRAGSPIGDLAAPVAPPLLRHVITPPAGDEATLLTPKITLPKTTPAAVDAQGSPTLILAEHEQQTATPDGDDRAVTPAAAATEDESKGSPEASNDSEKPEEKPPTPEVERSGPPNEPPEEPLETEDSGGNSDDGGDDPPPPGDSGDDPEEDPDDPEAIRKRMLQPQHPGGKIEMYADGSAAEVYQRTTFESASLADGNTTSLPYTEYRERSILGAATDAPREIGDYSQLNVGYDKLPPEAQEAVQTATHVYREGPQTETLPEFRRLVLSNDAELYGMQFRDGEAGRQPIARWPDAFRSPESDSLLDRRVEAVEEVEEGYLVIPSSTGSALNATYKDAWPNHFGPRPEEGEVFANSFWIAGSARIVRPETIPGSNTEENERNRRYVIMPVIFCRTLFEQPQEEPERPSDL